MKKFDNNLLEQMAILEELKAAANKQANNKSHEKKRITIKKNENVSKEIVCGTDKIDVSDIKEAFVRKVTDIELEKIEFEKSVENGYDGDSSYCISIDEELQTSIQKIMNEYRYDLVERLPEPEILESDIPSWACDTNPKHWLFQKYGNHEFSLRNFEYIDDKIWITWKFEIKYDSERGVVEETFCHITLNKVMDIFNELINIPKSDIEKSNSKRTAKKVFGAVLDVALFACGSMEGAGIGSDEKPITHTYERIQTNIRPVYKKYMSELEKSEKRKKEKADFIERYKDKYVLCLDLENSYSKKYLEDFCGFDIFAKEKEILEELSKVQKYQEKIENSNNDGEKTVEYALEWFIKSNPSTYIVRIKGDCESKYRLNCILLNKPDFIDDPQEYDHILVCSAGVVLIETKHWKGTVEIRADGQWIKENENGSIGVESPKFQMRRHELMMQKIVPDVKVHSLLCFSNGKIIINGKGNFMDYPVVTIDQLEENLAEICSMNLYTKDDIDSIVNDINRHKVNIK